MDVESVFFIFGPRCQLFVILNGIVHGGSHRPFRDESKILSIFLI